MEKNKKKKKKIKRKEKTNDKMNAYNFNMSELLDTFGGDAEQLANAFANSLNAELAKQRHKDSLKDAATDVCDAWADFIDEYVMMKEMPENYNVEEFYLDPDTVVEIMDVMVRLYPYVELFHEYNEKLKGITDDNNKPEKKPGPTATSRSYEDIINEFFQRNNI